jgi:hypothetical protein
MAETKGTETKNTVDKHAWPEVSRHCPFATLMDNFLALPLRAVVRLGSSTICIIAMASVTTPAFGDARAYQNCLTLNNEHFCARNYPGRTTSNAPPPVSSQQAYQNCLTLNNEHFCARNYPGRTTSNAPPPVSSQQAYQNCLTLNNEHFCARNYLGRTTSENVVRGPAAPAATGRAARTVPSGTTASLARSKTVKPTGQRDYLLANGGLAVHMGGGDYLTPNGPMFHVGGGNYLTPDGPMFHVGGGNYRTPDGPMFHMGRGNYRTPDGPMFHMGRGNYRTPNGGMIFNLGGNQSPSWIPIQ